MLSTVWTTGAWGPILKRPGNLSDPQSNNSWKYDLLAVKSCYFDNYVSNTYKANICQDSKLRNMFSLKIQRDLCHLKNFRTFEKPGPGVYKYDIPMNSTSCRENSDFFHVFASDHEKKKQQRNNNKQTNKTEVIFEWREQIELSTNPALVHRRWIKHVHSSVSIAATRYPEHVRKVGEALPIVLRDPHMTIAVQIGCEISCQNNNGIPVVPCPVHICQVVTVVQLELSRERCNLKKIKWKPKIKSQDPVGTLTKAKDHQIFHCISHLVHFLWWVNF